MNLEEIEDEFPRIARLGGPRLILCGDGEVSTAAPEAWRGMATVAADGIELQLSGLTPAMLRAILRALETAAR